MPFSKLGFVGLGEDPNVGSPRGNGNYANLGSNHHGTVLLASNLYMDDGADNLKVANTHSTMAGAAIQIPGNLQPRQNHIEFWTTPPKAVVQGQNFGDISTLRVVVTPTGYVGIGTPSPEAPLHLAPHPGAPNEEVWIEASNPGSGVTAFTRLRAVTSNGVRESQLLFGGECSFVWLPSRDGTGGQQARNTLTLLVNTDPAGNVTARSARFDSDVVVRNDQGGEVIRLDRQAGTIEATDILLTQADFAEDFDLAPGEAAEPGSVVVIDDEGALKESYSAYDRKVAGVISGAGDYKPGVTLDRRSPGGLGRIAVALSGKVYCKVDASYHPIEVGDLLVSSPTRAHAMKAGDPMRSFGAVIGKALRGLPSGRGLIPILVALQ
jgi:hypothetical protein